jgi:acyl carrier protein
MAEKRSSAEIQEWIVAKLAEVKGVYIDEIDARAPMAELGLDSVAALDLTGALEDWLGRSLSPTLLYKQPNLEALAKFLAK